MWIFVLWFTATAAILGSATGVITWTEDQNTLSVAKTTNIDSLVTGSQLNVRAQFNSSKEGVIKFLTEADLTAFYLAVATDGLTVTCGNDRTKFTKNLRSPLKEGESYEYQVDITNEGYSTTFQREKLPVTLYAKSDWQCMHVDTDFGGYDIHEGNSSGIADCYNRCLNMTNCEAFAIVYKGSISLKQVNWCWCKSRKYGRGATRLVNIKAANMDCFIDNTDVKKLQGSGAVFNELTLGILQGRNNVECDRLACDETNECEPDKLIKTQDQCCPVCNTTKNGTCVTVAGNTLCNVTVAWTPRVSETGAIFAMIVPVLFTVVMFVLYLVIRIKLGYKTPGQILRTRTGETLIYCTLRNI
ncbi:uncharacterized protein LOC134821197 [Bolinopsis microptera]|uniref:uncharacterized protein LOC134821197 n=1 Tax=Bolinopsis microptera TaxID=2820187 RepID=UPI003078DDA8